MFLPEEVKAELGLRLKKVSDKTPAVTFLEQRKKPVVVRCASDLRARPFLEQFLEGGRFSEEVA